MLKNHLWDIFEAAENNGVAYHTAEDMFRGDLKAGTNENTGLDLDWPALHIQWLELGNVGQNDANKEVSEVIKSKYNLLASAWLSGDRDRFEAIVRGE